MEERHMNPTAGQVAIELRRLADALDKEPDAPTARASIFFPWYYLGAESKNIFLHLAKVFPRPLTKEMTDREVEIKYSTPALEVRAYIDRNKVCTLKEPAKSAVWECEPLLSEADEAAFQEATA